MRISKNLFPKFKSSVRQITNYVPNHSPTSTTDVAQLQEFVTSHRGLFVLTGAGLSTESGIPDYRSKSTGLYSRTNHRPMKIQEFLQSDLARKRYWARNYTGWHYFSSRQPNIGHKILTTWQDAGIIKCLVTQNVDGLHEKAKSHAIELHGTGYAVNCLSCHGQVGRVEFQHRLESFNPGFLDGKSDTDNMQIHPDGDIYLNENLVQNFQIPECEVCGSNLMQPDIVFFGANVKRSKVESIYAQLEECDSILILGSSLQVFSGLRFVLRGHEMGLPIAILTLGGETRADHLARLRINARIGEILPLISLEL